LIPASTCSHPPPPPPLPPPGRTLLTPPPTATSPLVPQASSGAIPSSSPNVSALAPCFPSTTRTRRLPRPPRPRPRPNTRLFGQRPQGSPLSTDLSSIPA
jgi:hypothetical protein